jgi:hypothetical protein
VNNYPKKRTDYLLSGLMKCEECGSSYISMGGGKHIKFGCSARRERSTCTNRRMIARSIIDNSVLFALQEHLLSDECIKPAIKAYETDLAKHVATLETTRPKLERRLKQIQETRRKLLLLLEKGVEPEAIEDRMLELDSEERTNKRQLKDAPQPIDVDFSQAREEYEDVIGNLRCNTLQDNFAYKKEVMSAVRELVDEVIIYPSNDSQGRDVELGDIETLCFPKGLGMEAMVPGGFSWMSSNSTTKLTSFRLVFNVLPPNTSS